MLKFDNNSENLKPYIDAYFPDVIESDYFYFAKMILDDISPSSVGLILEAEDTSKHWHWILIKDDAELIQFKLQFTSEEYLMYVR